MNQQKLQLFICDIEKLHDGIISDDIKSNLCNEFNLIKEKYVLEKETKSLWKRYEEIEKKLKSTQREREGPEAIPIDIVDYRTECKEEVLKERIKKINKKLKNIESESLIFSCLKGFLLWRHKKALGHKDFLTFLDKTDERYD